MTLTTTHIIFTEISPSKEKINFKTQTAGELIVIHQKQNALYTLNFSAGSGEKTESSDGMLLVLCNEKAPVGVYKARDYLLVYENEVDIK